MRVNVQPAQQEVSALQEHTSLLFALMDTIAYKEQKTINIHHVTVVHIPSQEVSQQQTNACNVLLVLSANNIKLSFRDNAQLGPM